MSGIIGHTMYAILGERAAAAARLPICPLLRRHWPSYLCGAYLGCDIQVMPEAICVDTGREVGFGTVPLAKSPLTGGAVRPWLFHFKDVAYTPNRIHETFYGRAHLIFGWKGKEARLAVPWDHLADYGAAALEDILEFHGPGERALAYAFGWLVHVVGDSLIKSIVPGVDLQLLDGKYTPRNRPVQDLITYHEVGVKELGLNWPALLADLVDTPIEPAQLHYMRVGAPRGRLGKLFPDGWAPEQADLLSAVLAENRRYLKLWVPAEVKALELTATPDGPECRQAIRDLTGLTYAQMIKLADEAHFRRTLWQMGQVVADLFAQVVSRAPSLQHIAMDDAPTWAELTRRWK